MAAQDQATTTSAVKVKIHKQQGSPLCQMCKEKEESIGHVLSEYTKLAQTQYKSRHNRVADVVHWNLYHKYGLQCTSRWYKHYGREHPVMGNDEVKILWDFNVETEHAIVHRQPDIVVLEKKEKKALLIGIAVPCDVRVEEEEEKVTKYQWLTHKVKRLW